MNVRAAKLQLLVFTLAASGCSAGGGSESSSDCDLLARADGIVYTSWAYTERPATRFSEAELSDCHDVGPDPRGSVFPEDPSWVDTWRFRGYPVTEVLGVDLGGRELTVFVAESVPPRERERIREDLEDRSR